MVFDALRRALSSDEGERPAALSEELARVQQGVSERLDQLEAKRGSRLDALFPEGPVAGSGPGRYPELDPVNFEEAEELSWLVAAATGIIDNFPGSERLLSQLDATFHAFSEANHLRVRPDGPYGELVRWQEETFRAWDLDRSVPIYVSNGVGAQVLGCAAPFVVLGRFDLEVLDTDERRFLLASCLAHVFFGNLRIFAFYRLMEMLDKLPSMTGLVTRGLGMIPGVGNTISRGIELARTLNNQVIRKTNLVVGQRQHVLCDRLACLALGSHDAAQRYLAERAIGGQAARDPATTAQLIEQGREVQRRFEAGEVDLTMLSIVGPDAHFAALRAFKLDQWTRSERASKLAAGYYVTRSRLAEYRRTHTALEEEIAFLEERLLELHKRETKLREELAALQQVSVPPADPLV